MWHLICPSLPLTSVCSAAGSGLAGARILPACWQTLVLAELREALLQTSSDVESQNANRWEGTCALGEMQSWEAWWTCSTRQTSLQPMGRPQWTSVGWENHAHPRTRNDWEVKKEPFLSYHPRLTPPKAAHSGRRPSGIQKGHTWVQDWQGAKEVPRGKSAIACFSNSHIWTDRQVTDWDSLNIVGLWDQDWLSKSFLPNSTF